MNYVNTLSIMGIMDKLWQCHVNTIIHYGTTLIDYVYYGKNIMHSEDGTQQYTIKP